MKKILLLILISLPMTSAKAQSSEPTPLSDDVVIIKETPNVVFEHSSEHNRMSKKWEVSLMPFGAGPTPGISSGLNVGFYWNRKTEVLLSLTTVTKGATCWGDLSCDQKANTAGVYFKRFVGNSFYYSLGLDRRKVSYSEQMNSGGFQLYNYSFDGDSTSLAVVIGNQWHWDNVTVGCDWFGATIPFMTSFANEQFSGSNDFSEDLNEKKNYYVKRAAPQALKFYVGASF